VATRKAARGLGMSRPQFAKLANMLRLNAVERSGKFGGKPAKYYSSVDVSLIKSLMDRCIKLGGRVVLTQIAVGKD
jgi:hypothetical protein